MSLLLCYKMPPVFHSLSSLLLHIRHPSSLPVLVVSILQLQYPLVNFTSTLLCDATGVQPDVVKGKAMVVMRGVCDFSQKALVAQSLGATLLLLASNTTLVGHF